MGLLWSKRRQQQQNQVLRQQNSSSHSNEQQKLPVFTYGNAIFSLKQEDSDEIQRINENNFQIFFHHDWNLQYREFQKGNWSQVFQRIIEASVQILALYMSGSTNIIKEIQHIKFTNLQILSLGNNKIYSIEGLAFLNINKLKALRLNENFITSIQPLTKLNFNNLKVLLLAENQIVEFHKMNRIKFNSVESGANFNSKLSIDLRLENEEKAYGNQMNVDIGFLIKIELKSINNLIRNNAGIHSQHIDCLRKRNNEAINII